MFLDHEDFSKTYKINIFKDIKITYFLKIKCSIGFVLFVNKAIARRASPVEWPKWIIFQEYYYASYKQATLSLQKIPPQDATVLDKMIESCCFFPEETENRVSSIIIISIAPVLFSILQNILTRHIGDTDAVT